MENGIAPPDSKPVPAATPAEPEEMLQDAAAAEAPVEEGIVAEEPTAGAQAAETESIKAPKSAVKTPKEKPAATPLTGASTGEGRARRERKAAQPLYQVEAKKEEEFVIKEGKGSKLRDIPNVVFKLSKITGKDELLESLHSVLFRRKGTANQRKKAILEFSGWAFEESAHEKEVEGRAASLGKWKLELIHRLMDTLDLPRGSGDKSAKTGRVMEFLAAPRKESDVDLAAKEAAKKDKERAKRERALTKKQKAKAGKRKAGGASAEKKGRQEKKAKREEEGEEEEVEEEAEAESEVDESEAEDKEEDEVKKEAPKKAQKKAAAAEGKKAAAAEGQKAAGAAAPAAPAGAGEDAGATEEAAPPATQDPGQQVPPSKLADDVKAILAKMSRAELGMLTIKPLTTALQEQYGFSVRSRKQEIRKIAQAYADSLPPEEDA